ncbi:triose-phosphate isomerase [Idiomarina sp.]|uniref:triose-phosphate isomerase n=1 Tax=Idiomarina sp. TaxID=1874361 RepID=UPI002ECC0BDD|nr:triose-phosphate isomerase [Pseudomonadota bacterium]|tara:strand:- start:761 stop:1519 length:759 start_codon:yes stop_codon:yes gene_type:complete
MSNAPLVIANWKMNGNRALTRTMSEVLRDNQADFNGVKVVVCPPFTLLAEMAGHIYYDEIALGAQNVSEHESGAHTGEISVAMLQELGVEYVLLGHSERRAEQQESDQVIAAKAAAVTQAGLTAVVCVGEDKSQREADKTWSVIQAQLENSLANLSAKQMAHVVVAYEPVWAIGTGETASPAQAQEVHAKIRGWLVENYQQVGAKVPLLYGGSVKANNAESLFSEADINGGLIGGASLKGDEFSEICRAAKG